MGLRQRWGWLTTAVALVLTAVVVIVMGQGSGGTTTQAGPTTTTNPGPITPAGQATPAAGPTPALPAPTGAQPAWMHKLKPGEKPPQFIMFSFDGGASKEHWERVLPIA